MRHIAPIAYSITGIAGRSVCIAEDEFEHVGTINHGFEVVDLGFVGRIPRAIEVWVFILLHIWELGGCPQERKVNDVQCGPKSDEKQKSSGVCVRHERASTQR